MNEPVRCGLTCATIEEFRAAFVARGLGVCFVAYPDELEEGRSVILDVVVAERAQLAIEGIVRAPDFDERGNTGVLVALSETSVEAVTALNQSLVGQHQVPELFAPTRHKAPTVKMVGGVVKTEPVEEPQLEPGATIDERFRIEAHIATGGMGDVYRANHIHLKRPVALKLLRRAFATDADMWARFQREAELVCQLESPHVVRVFDFGRTADGQPYLAMEYVQGVTLDKELEKGPLPPARAVALLAQVCEGVAEAHALGVIHRDLKPANLMIGHKRDGAEIVKVLDFGIARLADRGERSEKQKLTQLGIVVGTPAYLAPEQALADDLDERSDIYALGCVAYELLTGRPPFVSDELSRVISMQLTATPAPLDSLRPELAQHPGLGAAVLKALAKERRHRFASVQELSKALSSGLGGPSGLGGLSAAAAARPTVPSAPTDGDWTARASAPSPQGPDEWPPQPTPGTSPSSHDVAAVADFFGETSADGAADGATGGEARSPLEGLAAPQVVAALERARRRAQREQLTRGLFAWVEVLGIPTGSEAAAPCRAELLKTAAAFDGFVELVSDEGLLLGFTALERLPVARAALALTAMREAVALEAARLGVSAKLRGAIVSATLRRGPDARLSGGAEGRARTMVARFQPGQLVLERSLAAEVGAVLDVVSSAAADAVQLAPRRTPPRRFQPELLGRQGVLETLERRLGGLAQGVVAPLVVRGPAGAGRSALALEIGARARKRSMVVAHVSAFPAWQKTPLAAISALVCAVCGVPFELRARLLRPALEGLELAPSLLEAVLVVAGVSQLPVAFTAGQAAHALRGVLKAGAQERPVVLLLDGLEHLDEPSLETFAELVARPASRELTIGFASSSMPQERLAGTVTVELQPLAPAEIGRLVLGTLGAAPGPRLTALLAEAAQGLPGPVHDWLALLEDRGALRVNGGAVELVDDAPEAPLEALPLARLAVLSGELHRVLEAASCQGESFEVSAVSTAWPKVTQSSFQQVATARLVTPLTGRRWGFASPRVLDAVERAPSLERPLMHGRLALALVEQGKADAASVDSLVVGRHFLLAHDGMRAAALFQHAADVAVARRAPRDLGRALKGLADALGLTRAVDVTARRVECLARAAANALVVQDAPGARALVDEGEQLAAAGALSSAELSLSLARVLRSEARRAKATEALEAAAHLAKGTPLQALVDVELGEAKEQAGDVVGAMVTYEAALLGAAAATPVAQWHGEIELAARIEARLAALSLQQKDLTTARRLFESSARRWRDASSPAGEARALSNLATSAALMKDLGFATKCYHAASEAAALGGDFLFQARCLLQEAKAAKKLDPASGAVRVAATEARRLAVALGWEQGRQEAGLLLS
jgi:serine/threonine-protein kinase